MTDAETRHAIDEVLDARSDGCILTGDALAILPMIPAASIGAVITDPPYSSGGAFRSDRMQRTNEKYVMTSTLRQYAQFTGDNRDQRAYGYWSALWLAQCLRAAVPGAPLCMFTDWRQLPITTDALQAGGWIWRGIVPWDKTLSTRPAKARFRNQCEYVVWGSAGPMPAPPADAPCLPGMFSHRVTQADKHHMTGKPTALMRDLVRITPPGGIILDPFAGSGTTAVAAKAAGYRYIAVESVPANAETAARRLDTVPRPLFPPQEADE